MGSLKYHIKKIIKEEFDEFDWVRDTNPIKIDSTSSWVLINDVDPDSYEEGAKIQNYLFTLGYLWNSGTNLTRRRLILAMCHGKYKSLSYISSHEIDYLDESLEKNRWEKVYKWSEVMNTPPVKESEEDDFLRIV